MLLIAVIVLDQAPVIRMKTVVHHLAMTIIFVASAIMMLVILVVWLVLFIDAIIFTVTVLLIGSIVKNYSCFFISASLAEHFSAD